MTDTLTRAWLAIDRGRLTECARLLAVARTQGVDSARVDCVAGLARCVAGDHAAAIGELTAVLPALDRKWSANALVGRGTAYAYSSRLVEADADFAAAAAIYGDIGAPGRAAACTHNRGFVALQAGNVPLALRLFDEAGLDPRRYPEALLDRAQALVAAGLVRDAQALLNQASTLLAGRGAKLAEARFTVAYCALRAGNSVRAADMAARAVDSFRRQGRDSWRIAARAVELMARGGRSDVMRRVADQCDLHGWPVLAAELRWASGDRSALVDLTRGRHAGAAAVRVLGWLARATLATDRRGVLAACRAGLTVDAHSGELIETGLRAAMAGGRPRTALRWADRLVDRAVALPADRELATRLTALRSATVAGAVGRVRKLERQVRALDAAGRGDRVISRWSFTELFDALGGACLVHSFVHDGRTRTVTCFGGRCRLDGRVADGDLVVVPASWRALPVWQRRTVTMVPSVGAWLRARRADVPGVGRLWLAGPGLRHAATEVRSLHARYGGELRIGRAATAKAALAAMDGADLVHIAAHGRFRAEQPLFSCLELSGGPLFGYDVQRLPRPPRRVVLAACETIGLARAFLRAGTATVIASAWRIPDRQAVRLVTALHAGLAAGLRPAQALADAQAEHGHHGFVCLGAG